MGRRESSWSSSSGPAPASAPRGWRRLPAGAGPLPSSPACLPQSPSPRRQHFRLTSHGKGSSRTPRSQRPGPLNGLCVFSWRAVGRPFTRGSEVLDKRPFHAPQRWTGCMGVSRTGSRLDQKRRRRWGLAMSESGKTAGARPGGEGWLYAVGRCAKDGASAGSWR